MFDMSATSSTDGILIYFFLEIIPDNSFEKILFIDLNIKVLHKTQQAVSGCHGYSLIKYW